MLACIGKEGLKLSATMAEKHLPSVIHRHWAGREQPLQFGIGFEMHNMYW